MKTEDNVVKVREVIRSNHRLTVREVAEEVSISKTVCHEILTENLGMHRIAAKFVPRLLTDDQKRNRVDMSQELLDRANDDDNFLKNIITGDETWVYRYDVETKVGVKNVATTKKITPSAFIRPGDADGIF